MRHSLAIGYRRERGERGPRCVRVAAGKLRPGLPNAKRHPLRPGGGGSFGVRRRSTSVACRHQQIGPGGEQLGSLRNRRLVELELDGGERLVEGGTARDAGVESERLDPGPKPQSRERAVQLFEGAKRSRPVTGSEPSAHHRELSRFIRRIGVRRFLPASRRAKNVEVTGPKPPSRLLGPRRIGIVGEQLPGIERRIGGRLEPLDIGLDARLWSQHHNATTKHEAVGVAERPAGVMRCLVQVGHGCVDAELRPELVQNTVP